LSRLSGEVVRRVEIPETTANRIAEALRESQADKGRFHRTAVMQLMAALHPYARQAMEIACRT
jgi:hypothetical protein